MGRFMVLMASRAQKLISNLSLTLEIIHRSFSECVIDSGHDNFLGALCSWLKKNKWVVEIFEGYSRKKTQYTLIDFF